MASTVTPAEKYRIVTADSGSCLSNSWVVHVGLGILWIVKPVAGWTLTTVTIEKKQQKSPVDQRWEYGSGALGAIVKQGRCLIPRPCEGLSIKKKTCSNLQRRNVVFVWLLIIMPQNESSFRRFHSLNARRYARRTFEKFMKRPWTVSLVTWSVTPLHPHPTPSPLRTC